MPLSRVFREPFDDSWDLERKVDWVAQGMIDFRNAVNTVIRTTNAQIHRTSVRLLLLTVVVILDVASTAGFALVLTGQQNACNQSNVARTATRNLWKHLVDISHTTTPQQHQEAQQFISYVNMQFHPLDCSLAHQL